MLVTTNGQQTLWETILPPGYQNLPGRAGGRRRAAGGPGVRRAVPGALLRGDGAPVDTDRDLPADDVPQAPLRAGLREPVPGGGRLDLLVAVLPDPAGDTGAAPVDVGQADRPLRRERDRAAERGAAGQGGRGQGGQDRQGPRGHHRGPGERGLPDRLRAAGPRDRGDHDAGGADSRRRRRVADQGAGPAPGGWAAGAVDLGAPEAAQRAGQGQRAGDHRRAGRPGRGQRHRGQQGAGQCPPPCRPPRCGHLGAAGLGDR